MKFLLFVLLGVASAFQAPNPSTQRPATHLNENFGLGVGENTYENQVAQLGGEANYKQWVNKVQDNSFVNRKVSLLLFILNGNDLSSSD